MFKTAQFGCLIVHDDSLLVSTISAAVTVKTTSAAPPLTGAALHVSPAGTGPDATAGARLVLTVTAARGRVHGAETMRPVTQPVGNACSVILDGQDPGVLLYPVVLF